MYNGLLIIINYLNNLFYLDMWNYKIFGHCEKMLTNIDIIYNKNIKYNIFENNKYIIDCKIIQCI